MNKDSKQTADGRRQSRRTARTYCPLPTASCLLAFIHHPSSLIPSLALWQPADFGGAQAEGGVNFFLMLLQTLAALGLVCGLAYVIFRWLLPRLGAVRPAGGQMVRVVERVGLDPRRSLYVVEVAGRWLLISSSEAGVHLVSELDAETAREAASEIERLRPTFGADAAAIRGAFAERLTRVMNRKGGGR